MHKNARLTPAGREVARSMAVSRRTVYKWLKRWEEEGVKGLEDRSSRPLSCPSETSPGTVAEMVQLRRERRWTAEDRLDAQACPLDGGTLATEFGDGEA